EVVVEVVCRPRDGASDAARLAVSVDCEHALVASLPRFDERVREQGEGARLALAVAHQDVDQAGLESQAGAQRGLLDRLTQGIAGERADEMQAALGDAAELFVESEAAEVVAAYRDHDRPVLPRARDDARGER